MTTDCRLCWMRFKPCANFSHSPGVVLRGFLSNNAIVIPQWLSLRLCKLFLIQGRFIFHLIATLAFWNFAFIGTNFQIIRPFPLSQWVFSPHTPFDDRRGWNDSFGVEIQEIVACIRVDRSNPAIKPAGVVSADRFTDGSTHNPLLSSIFRMLS